MATEYKAATDDTSYLVHTILHNKPLCDKIISEGGKLEDLIIICASKNKERFHPSWNPTFEKVQIVFQEPFKPIELNMNDLKEIADKYDLIVENYVLPSPMYKFSFFTTPKKGKIAKLLSKPKKYSAEAVAHVGPQWAYFNFSSKLIDGYTGEGRLPAREVRAAFCDILKLYLK
jgi:hypothetical protein